MAHRVHPAVKGVEPPGGHAPRHGGPAQAHAGKLRDGHDAVLASRDPSQIGVPGRGWLAFVRSS